MNFGQQFEDFILDHIGKLFAGAVLFGVLAIALLVRQDHRDQKAFMDECLTELRTYQCVALWRRGDDL